MLIIIKRGLTLKSSIFFLAIVLIVGIVFSSSLVIEDINSNIVKPKFSPVIKKALSSVKPIKSFKPVDTCTSEGKPPGVLGCCKDLIVVNGICKRFSTRNILLSCAKETERMDIGQRCCQGLEPVNFVCKRKKLSVTPPNMPAPSTPSSIPNPLGQCGTFDEPPTLVGCCDDLIDRNGKCVYPYECAGLHQPASEHNNRCCVDFVINEQGLCANNQCGEIWQTASYYSGPNHGCCLSYAPDANGVCKQMGCASEGEVMLHYARGCCRGLEPDSAFCKLPCAKENERESSKPGGCCSMYTPDEQGICNPVEMSPPNPTAGFPSPY